MKKIIFLLFSFMLIGGCVPKNTEKNPKLTNILEGNNLNDLGLHIDLDNLKTFSDPNRDTNYVQNYDVLHIESEIEHSPLDENISIVGNISILGILYTDTGISMEFVPALYFQGFEKKPANDSYIKIGSQLYPLAELQQYMIYEDNNVIVLNLTELLPLNNFHERIDNLTEMSDSDYSYKWIINVYDYLQSCNDIKITKKQ